MRRQYIRFLLTLAFGSLAAGQIVLDPNPARVMGHPAVTPPEQLLVTNINPDFGALGGVWAPQGVAVDTSGSTPILYVADYGNNRVLAWKNATALGNLQPPDLFIGQPNAFTTFPLTNGGLDSPTALLVDPSGNLYVADSGNNRVLRYPAPFAGGSPTPDIVLGQPDPYTSRSANQGGSVSATTLNLAVGSSLYLPATMAMDSSGNLFLADPGNSRVLRFPAKVLTSGAIDPAADLAVGQNSLTAVTGPSGNLDQHILYFPSGVAFDAEGHLFVIDAQNRLVVFPPTVSTSAAGTNGIGAIRFAGIINSAASGSACATTPLQCTMNAAQGVVIIDDGPAVVDTGNNRILVFDAFKNNDWTLAQGDTTLANPPLPGIAVLGQGTTQANFTSILPNANNPQAVVAGSDTATFFAPSAGIVAAGDLYVADSYNNRVLIYQNAGSAGTISVAASTVLGQSDFPYNSPNSIQGAEFDFGVGGSGDAGIVVDSSSTPPHLYISDPNNHRVLGFADARAVVPGKKADLVIGQPNLQTAVCNYGGVTNPSSERLPRQPTQSSLCYPTGLAVDGAGNLFVADSDNGRVLRFPAPFTNSSEAANLVLGQAAYTGISNPTAGQSVMVFPYGLVYDSNFGLWVSDLSANRVLLFPLDNAGNGEPASKVLGQTNFAATGTGTLNQPHHIGEDSILQIYVADSNNNRIAVFAFPSGSSSTQVAYSLSTLEGGGGGLTHPQALWVNSSTIAGFQDDIWVGDASSISRFAPPNALSSNVATLTMPAAEIQGGQSINCSGSGVCSYAVLAVTQDGFGNLYAADATNRVAIHYPALRATNSANYACAMGCTVGTLGYPTVPLAPGAFGTLFFVPQSFGTFTADATVNGTLPVPTTLAGVQVLINGQGSPITYAGPGQINFIVPFEAPQSGTAELVVVNAATSQVLGSGSLNMAEASPAFFTTNSAGTGQIAALNCNTTPCDNTLNGTAHPANYGSTIQLFLTGQGDIPNAPPDGSGECAAVPTSATPQVVIGATLATVSYSGLAPCYPGLWQINVQIPSAANLTDLPTGFPVGVFPVLVVYNDYKSNTTSNNMNPSVATTIMINAPE